MKTPALPLVGLLGLFVGAAPAAPASVTQPAPAPAAASPAPARLRLLPSGDTPVGDEPAALVAGQAVTLELLLPDGHAREPLSPVFRQLSAAGGIAAPLTLDASLAPAAADDDGRLARLRMVPPEVTRVTRLGLWLGESGPLLLTVFPAARPRPDLAPVADALAASRLRLALCGPGRELRAHLRAEGLAFEDLGTEVPDHAPDGALLLATLRPEEWERLAARPGGALLAFVEELSPLPGVYARLDGPGQRSLVKVTLPLAARLAGDPRARETFHRLLLQSLSSPQP